MAVKLNITTNVTGQGQITKLNSGLTKLGTQALIAKKRLGNLERAAAKSRATFSALGTTLKVGVAASLAAVTFGLGKFVKDTFAAGRLTESLQVRFKLLFNSVKEGSKAFKVMNNFASKVPFSLEAIAAGSGNLAVISKDAGDLNKILEVTGNVAAATGLDFRQTAEQIQRAFAGGIAAADVFRERGVRAMLGFEAGAKVSIEETRKKFFEVFANGGQFSKATGDFEKTLEAQVSFVEDAYFRFRQAAAVPLFAGVKAQLVELVGNFKENDAQLKILAERIGKSLANGFKNLGKFIKLIVENFDSLVKAVKIFLALKIVSFIGGIGAQLVIMGTAAKGATGAMAALNISMRANPLGLFITGVQLAAAGIIIFKDEIGNLINGALKNFSINLRKMKISFLKFRNLFNRGLDKDANVAAIQILEAEIRGLTVSWDEATEAKFSYLKGSRFDDNTKAIEKSIKAQNDASAQNRKQIVQDIKDRRANSQALELAESMKTKFRMRKRFSGIDAGGSNPEKDQIDILADAHIKAHQKRLGQVKEYRAQLSLIGVDSKIIGGIIGDTWLQGIKEGNSLLETTKNAFKNVLVSISDTIVKRSAELLVEKLFNTFLDQRIMKQKVLNSATSEQGNIMSSLISKSSSLFSSMGGSKIGGLFSSLFGGGGGSNLMGLGSKKGFFGMNKGGVVPGGAPYTDRIPTMLTPGEVVIPRNKTDNTMGSTNITNINISGNVDQRSIDQIKGVIAQSSAEVGGANRTFQRNSQGVRGRGR